MQLNDSLHISSSHNRGHNSVQPTLSTTHKLNTHSEGKTLNNATNSIPPVKQNKKIESDQPENNRLNPNDNNTNKTSEKNNQTADHDTPQIQSKTEEQEKQQKQKIKEEEKNAVIRQLQARDQEVRQHEQAHAATAGQFAGSPQYDYTRGPDGRNYATSGSVDIDISKEESPEKTLEKARVIRRAALAPSEPSAQDRQVAAEAAQLAAQAQIEINQEKTASKPNEIEEGGNNLSEQTKTNENQQINNTTLNSEETEPQTKEKEETEQKQQFIGPQPTQETALDRFKKIYEDVDKLTDSAFQTALVGNTSNQNPNNFISVFI